MKRRTRRGLTQDDREVWEQVRRTVEPLDAKKKAPPKNEEKLGLTGTLRVPEWHHRPQERF